MEDLRIIKVPVSAARDHDYFARPREPLVTFAAQQSIQGEVIDFGCASGLLGARLRQLPGISRVTGVELDGASVEAARSNLDCVIHGSLTDDQTWEQLPLKVGAIVFADVLEHLEFPGTVLARAAKLLNAGGWAIISVPNVNHYRVVASLVLRGEWEYTDFGVLDRTHLRFYTTKSAVRLVTDADLVLRDTAVPLAPRSATLGRFSHTSRRFLASQTFIAAQRPSG